MTQQGFPPRRLRIGTRGSPLALVQAHHVRDRLVQLHAGLTPELVDIVEIRTSGDRIQDRPLADAGGKGLFTKEIEEALYDGSIDIAVHSMKDMPTALPPGLVIPCLLPREDPRDAFLSLRWPNLAALPAGAVLGTSSLRRKAQLLHKRPDLSIVDFRGNVNTRLRKLEEGVASATLLAFAGLRRLGMADRATAVLEVDDLLPAVAQGAIGVECRADDDGAHRLLAPLADAVTTHCVDAERALLEQLRARRTELEAREQSLVSRELVLTAAERRLGQRIEELTQLQQRLEAMERTRGEREESGWRGLVRTYESMRPREAAAIFEELELPVVIQILDRMGERKMAPVIGAMRPEKARILTAELARHRANRPGSE